MNSQSSKTSDPHRTLLNLADKIILKRINKYISNPSFYYAWKNVKKPYKNDKLKISALT